MTSRVDGHLARWILLGLAVLLTAGVIMASAWENESPTASAQGSQSGTEPTTPPPSTVAVPPPTATPPPATYVFPVAGKSTYGREHHDYPAADIIAGCGQAVRAATDGVILEVSRIDRYDAVSDDGSERGGLFVSLLGDDGIRYYGSHLRAVGKGVEAGRRVKAGDTLGEVGDTGHASVCHLHFGISPPCAERADWWVRRGVIWPWSYLDSWRKGGEMSPVDAVRSWQKKYGCPGAP